MKAAVRQGLIETLKSRFETHAVRHDGILWSAVQAKIEVNPQALEVLHEMERTGGEPDVIAFNQADNTFTYCDCSPESPKGRRSICYDREALNSRKQSKPGGNAIEMAATLGVQLLTETQYRALQLLGEFDNKTSSWVKTPTAIRKLGGALFCDRRYGEVFMYHNGAESYYAARGFRGLLRI